MAIFWLINKITGTVWLLLMGKFIYGCVGNVYLTIIIVNIVTVHVS